MDDESPSARYAHMTKGTEIGSTSGEEHDAVLARTLGRERGLMNATGLSWSAPVIEGDEFEVVAPAPAHSGAPEGGTGKNAPVPPNEEINEKKLERHGDLGGEP